MIYSTAKMLQIKEAQEKLSTLREKYWIEDVVFSVQWCILFACTLIVFYLWIKLVDRTLLTKNLLYGFIILSIIMYLDILGAEFTLWDYPAMVLPWGPRLIFVDIMASIIFMYLYQRFPMWKKYIIATVVSSLIFSFLLEPLLVYMDIYNPYAWKTIYSFPIYILLGIVVKWVVDKIYSVEIRNK